MFTGLIRELAEVVSYTGDVLNLKAKHKPKLGDSIAINGACLTVISLESQGFSVELSHETSALLAVENLKGKVHMEPAMRLSDRVEGHIMQGHIDTVGIIKKIDKKESFFDFFIEVDNEFIPLIVPKGSIGIDGISLTVNALERNVFRLTIIPHTMKNTLFESYKIGQRVNIETDILVRSLRHLLSQTQTQTSWSDIDKVMALY